jgi:DNA-directed RNA polymerase specialized sigma24 family protein
MAETKRTRIEQVFRERYRPLYSFFLRRTRSAPDAAELAQEVYLRILRVQDFDAIREPEHYLLTGAKNTRPRTVTLIHSPEDSMSSN